MQRLDLDFCRTRRGSPWAGRLLLAVAVFCLADAGMSYQSARQAVKESEARLVQRSPAGRTPKASPQEVALVRETVQRLSLPWNELFAALESAASDRVVLAAIEPDTRSGTVKISGDSKDYLAALTYVLNLGRSDSLAQVQLVHHEQKAKDSNGPVSFAVSAAWSTK